MKFKQSSFDIWLTLNLYSIPWNIPRHIFSKFAFFLNYRKHTLFTFQTLEARTARWAFTSCTITRLSFATVPTLLITITSICTFTASCKYNSSCLNIHAKQQHKIVYGLKGKPEYYFYKSWYTTFSSLKWAIINVKQPQRCLWCKCLW